MPTYRFYDKVKDTEYEELMTIAEMEKFIKKKHITLLPPKIISQLSPITFTVLLPSATISSYVPELCER